MRHGSRCVVRSIHHFAAPRSVVILTLTALIGANAGSSAFAQSVNIAEELTENSETKVPILQTHPWRWFRNKWLDEMDRLDNRLGLRLGVSFTTIYQHAAGLSSPNNTAVATVDAYARWQLLDLGPFGQGTAGVLFRDRNNFVDLNGDDLSQSIGLPWGINNSGSPGYTRVNQLWWEQSMLQRTLILKVGRLDEKSLFDQNRVAASDAKQFMMQSLVHSQTIAFPSNGMGLNLRYVPSASLYVTAGFGDANGNPDRTATEGLDSFGKGQYFQAGEVGFSPDFSSLWTSAGHTGVAW
jgi:carbohydrate-selective porin OprB